jgi:hypothetical protein
MSIDLKLSSSSWRSIFRHKNDESNAAATNYLLQFGRINVYSVHGMVKKFFWQTMIPPKAYGSYLLSHLSVLAVLASLIN